MSNIHNKKQKKNKNSNTNESDERDSEKSSKNGENDSLIILSKPEREMEKYKKSHSRPRKMMQVKRQVR